MLLLSTDSPARCKVLEMSQFNGYYGCTYCYHSGVNLDSSSTVNVEGGSKKKKNNMRYPIIDNVRLRKHEDVIGTVKV